MKDVLSDGLDRRELLQSAVLFAAPLCCVTPEVPSDAIAYRGETLLLSLKVAKELQEPGHARAVVDQSRKLNLLVAHARGGEYVAIDRTCTHGGGQCAYNHRRQTVRCSSLNHAEYDLKGTLLHGRTHGNLRTYPVRLAGETIEIELGGAA